MREAVLLPVEFPYNFAPAEGLPGVLVKNNPLFFQRPSIAINARMRRNHNCQTQAEVNT